MDAMNYAKGTKLLHWVITVIVITLLSVSFFLDDVPKLYQGTAYMIHKSLGLTVLFLTLLMLLWRFHTGRPHMPESMPTWQKLLARNTQWALYLCLILMPLFGWILSVAAKRIPTYFGWFKMPLPIQPNDALAEVMELLHKKMAWILIALIVLHVIGALKHHFINKDEVLRGMWPRRSE